MAKLGTLARQGLPAQEFGLPGRRAYPMPDKSHAANAKARATQMVNAGKLSPASKSKIDAKANRVLGKKK
jgi:predicted AAA+ superfamily ATPase